MSPQESQTLQNFLSQLAQARGVVKDPEADALIMRAVSQQLDAAYLLVQRALLLEQALDAAKAQISTLQNQVQSMQSGRSGGFLDSANAWGNSASGMPRQTMQPTATTMQHGAAVMPAAPLAATPGFLGGGAGNILGTIAATAAGVAGGAFLFHGIENLMGHHGSSGFSGQQHGAAALPPENTGAGNHAGDSTLAADNSLAAEAGIDDVASIDDVTGADDIAGGDDGSSI
jgi:hypothetical protein